ncbi:MAG: hypothetical protein GX958_05135 [Desulfitobacterium sp.]|nr:hypothetical protein [Desulfitobacterium sp.]
MDALSLVVILAIVVEKIVDILKTIVGLIPNLPAQFRPLTLELLSLGFGVLLAYETQIDALCLIGVETQNNYIGIIITGLVVGKGANFAHDFFHAFDQKRKNKT